MGETDTPVGEQTEELRGVPARVVDTLVHSQYGILLLDEALDVVWVSESGAASAGYSFDQIVGHSAAEFLDPVQSAGVLEALAALLRSPELLYGPRGWVLPQRVRVRCGDGRSRDFEFGARAVTGEPPEMMLVFQDLSERVRLEDVLISVTEHDLDRALDQFLVLAAEQEQAGVGIMLHPSLGGGVYTSAEASPSMFDDFEPSHPTPQMRTVTAAGGEVVGWLYVDRQELSPWDVEILDRLGALLGIALSHHATFTRLADAATTDPLTGLSNRRALDLALDAARQDPSIGWAMLFCDLDRFKAINDVEGHAAGDAALRIVGERLRHLSRTGDVVARIGGDEFVVLAPIDHRQAEDLAQRVRTSLSRPIAIGQVGFVVGVSVGVATAATAAGIRRLLTAADDSMRADKAAHRLTAAGG